MNIDAMKQALEALEEYQQKGAPFMSCDAAVDALRLAIEQAEKPRTWEQFYKPESLNASYEGDDLYTGEQLRAAVAVAVAAEREACAKLCDSLEEQCEKLGLPDEKWPTPADCAAVIRARGQDVAKS